MKRYKRLTRPLVRDGNCHPERSRGELHEVSWDEALDRAAAAIGDASKRGGTQTFGMFSCSKASNELNFVAQKFVRSVVGSNNIDSCNRT
jgi:formate dehydrogenase major subunit